MRLRNCMGRRAMRTGVGVAWLSLALFSRAADFRTTSFNARLKVDRDRVLTIDENIEILPGNTGKLTNIILAEAPQGLEKVQYLVTHATLQSGQNSSPISVSSNGAGELVASFDASAKSTLKLHVNYMALGAFRDRSGGSLGERATMSWNVVPTSWPSAVESGLLEVEYPAHSVPVYVGADSGTGTAKLSIEKTSNTAFKGNTDALNVSEVSGGITMQPPSGLGANAGLHLLIAFPKTDLKPAPKGLKLPAAPPPQTAQKPTSPQTHRQASSQSPKNQPKTQLPKEPSLWPVFLPLMPPAVLFVFAFRRFSFLRKRGFPTSAIPEGIGPAEAGYLLEGALKPRHVLGAVALLPQISKPGSATIDSSTLRPVERRVAEILHEKGSELNAKDLRTTINGTLQELQVLVVQYLAAQGIVYPDAKRGRLAPSVALLVGFLALGGYSIYLDPTRGVIFTCLGVVLGGLLVYSLSPLTQKGVGIHRKVDGLNRFLASNSQEFRTENKETYLESLRPLAIAFGLASDGLGA